MKKSIVFVTVAMTITNPRHVDSGRERPWDIHARLKQKQWIDLTHASNGDDHWKGFEPATTKTLYEYEPDGFHVDQYRPSRQRRSHVIRVPVHKRKRRLDKIE